jgi:hypothetical protein
MACHEDNVRKKALSYARPDHTQGSLSMLVAIIFFDNNVVKQTMVHTHLKANTMYLLILPSDRDICRAATDTQQANHMCLESWLLFHCGVQSK